MCIINILHRYGTCDISEIQLIPVLSSCECYLVDDCHVLETRSLQVLLVLFASDLKTSEHQQSIDQNAFVR